MNSMQRENLKRWARFEARARRAQAAYMRNIPFGLRRSTTALVHNESLLSNKLDGLGGLGDTARAILPYVLFGAAVWWFTRRTS